MIFSRLRFPKECRRFNPAYRLVVAVAAGPEVFGTEVFGLGALELVVEVPAFERVVALERLVVEPVARPAPCAAGPVYRQHQV